jgi:hypothetical protein
MELVFTLACSHRPTEAMCIYLEVAIRDFGPWYTPEAEVLVPVPLRVDHNRTAKLTVELARRLIATSKLICLISKFESQRYPDLSYQLRVFNPTMELSLSRWFQHISIPKVHNTIHSLAAIKILIMIRPLLLGLRKEILTP